jgi:hypothetical protein
MGTTPIKFRKYRQLIEIIFVAEDDDQANGLASDALYVLKTNEIEANTHSLTHLGKKENRLVSGIEETIITR